MNAQQLKNSILQMAVQGKLVPQDPNDEPASVLLERIRTEKERLIKEGKIKKEKNPSYIFRGEDNLPYEKVGKNEPVCIADEVPFEIPRNWEWVRLGTVCTEMLVPQRDKPKSFGGNIPWCRIEDIEGKYLNGTQSNQYVSQTTVETMNLKVNPIGTVISANSASIGAAAICTVRCITNQTFIGLVCSCGLYNEYLYYFLKANVDTLKKLGTGTTISYISQDKYRKFMFPLPPLEEQKRIVARILELEPLIDGYNKTYEHLTKLDTELPVKLKKSILQQAVMGKLVPQDPNDEPASVLLERIRAEKQALIEAGKLKKDKHESIIYRRDNSHYEKQNDEDKCIDENLPFDIPDTWCWCRLNDLCETIFDIDHYMPKADPNGVLFLSAKDLLDDGSLNFDIDVKRISRVDFERLSRKGTPRKGDIIYSRIGACLGKARIVNTNIEFLVSYSCCTIRPMIINTQYLKILLDGGFVLSQAIEKTQSIGVPDLGMQMIKDFLIPLPPLDEQRRIVEKYTCCLEIIGTIS